MMHLCNRLVARGYEIDILTSRGNVPRFPTPGIRVHDTMETWGWPELPRLALWLRRIRPDAVFMRYSGWIYRHHPMMTFAPTVSRMLVPRAPFTTEFDNVLAELDFPQRWRVVRRIGASVMRRGDPRFGTMLNHSHVVIVLSEHHARVLESRCPGLVKRMTLVPPPPILNMSLDDSATRERTRQRLGVRAQDKLLGYFGYLYPGKGVETLLEAFKLVCARRTDCRLAIMGPLSDGDPYQQKLRQIASQSACADRIIFTGGYAAESDEGSAYLRTLDICVLPLDIGVQLNNSSLAGAVAHQLPVITTRGKAPERPFLDGQNMLMCPPKDPTAMAHAIERLLDDEDLRRTLSQGAAALAREWFSWDTAINRTLKALKGEAEVIKWPGLQSI
jgi:glycosyltransferase involved in cell wall biosynthesis